MIRAGCVNQQAQECTFGTRYHQRPSKCICFFRGLKFLYNFSYFLNVSLLLGIFYKNFSLCNSFSIFCSSSTTVLELQQHKILNGRICDKINDCVIDIHFAKALLLSSSSFQLIFPSSKEFSSDFILAYDLHCCQSALKQHF